MRKITFLTLLLACKLSFANGNKVGLENDIEVVQILDETLTHINYKNLVYENPTRLVFPNLKYVDNDIYIEFATNLVEIDFPVLDSISGSLFIWENQALQKFKAPSLEKNSGAISFHSNPKLEEVNLTNLKITDRDIHFVLNPELIVFNTPVLESTGDNFYFHSNTNLIEINAPLLKSVAKLLFIHGHQKLQKLNLCSLEFALYTDISGNNPVVDEPPYCPDLLDENEEQQEEEEEQEDDFENLEDEEDSEDDPTVEDEPTRVSLYPNPTRGVFRIDSEIEFVKIEIYEATGNLVTTFRTPQEEYDIGLFPSGLYYVVCHHTDGVHATVKKLMVQ
ncbi:T9SS type A sorting domain-containing protein [Flagellimonas algicola]|nr:T9SS type A sorting domain-containing protein [Allomuricauda algicola]